jgi:hypothetical protein
MRQVNKDFKNNASLVTKKSVAQDWKETLT